MNKCFNLLVFFLLLSVCSKAKVNVAVTSDAASTVSLHYNLNGGGKKSAVKKMGFLQRLIIKFYSQKISRQPDRNNSDDLKRIDRKSIWAKWLGIGSLIGLFIPGLGLLSLPAAIVAVAFGMQTQSKTSHPKYAKQGVIFGFITIGLLLIVGSIIALVTLLPVG